MALSQAQRYQFNLLGVPDGSLDEADRYGLAGVMSSDTDAPASVLTEAQRYQLNLLGVPDSSITVGDRYALAGVVQTVVSTGPRIETFEVTWVLDPTFDGYLLPQSNEGSIAAVLQSVHGGFIGTYRPEPRAEVVSTEVVGGFAAMNYEMSRRQREKKRKKDAKKRFEKEEWFLGPNGWTKVKY